ncbi:MAG: hypothetical protein E6H06_05745 [Bacteroidetes bacterium]|nr:MAG: hypothetical protein E6H06_05745 [Bacteroidota bacterium]
MGDSSILDSKVSKKNCADFGSGSMLILKMNVVLLKAKFMMMKMKNLLFILTLIFFLVGCSRAVTPAQAASGKYHHCRPVR